MYRLETATKRRRNGIRSPSQGKTTEERILSSFSSPSLLHSTKSALLRREIRIKDYTVHYNRLI